MFLQICLTENDTKRAQVEQPDWKLISQKQMHKTFTIVTKQ